MSLAVALLAGALFSGVLLPLLLRRLDLRRRDPAPVILAWILSALGVLLTASMGLALLLLPDHGLGNPAAAAVVDCWTTIQHGSIPRAEQWTTIAGAVAGVLITLRLVAVVGRQLRARARTSRRYRDLLRLAGRADADPGVLRLAHDRPMAFSLSGTPGLVVLTDGLTQQLTPLEVQAVLEHERAHLRGRHHLLLALADGVRAAFPIVPLFSRAPAALRDLLELAADTAAVRHCGATAVRSALLSVSGAAMPSTALGMAGQAIQVRLERLRDVGGRPLRLRRAVLCGVAGTSVLLLPLVAAGGMFGLLVAVVCPLPVW